MSTVIEFTTNVELTHQCFARDCPFCKSSNVTQQYLGGDFLILCRRCVAKGPKAKTIAQAVDKWNGNFPPAPKPAEKPQA